MFKHPQHQTLDFMMTKSSSYFCTIMQPKLQIFFIKFKSVSNYTNLNWFQLPSPVSINFKKACETKTNSAQK